MSTRKLGVYASKEEFLENEIRTLNHHIVSMIDTMKVMSMNRQDMSEELERMKQEIKSAVLAEREACAKVCDDLALPPDVARSDASIWEVATLDCAEAIRARGQQ